MFPFALSLFDTGLLIVVVVFMLLYLVVLIRLKPSTVGEKTVTAKVVKPKVRQPFPTERPTNPVVHHENYEEPAKLVKPIERPKSVSTVPVKTMKNDSSKGPQPSGCPHYYGYLEEHPKNTPIPNECLTCTKIMECLVGKE